MQLITSKQVQTKFGEVANIVQAHQPIAITQNGKPTMILMHYDDGMALLRQQSAKRFVNRLTEQATGLSEPTEQEMAELSQLIEAERNSIYQQSLPYYDK